MKYLLSLGSNLGNREQNILNAIKMLEGHIENVSKPYYSKALLPENCDEVDSWDKEYINVSCLLISDLDPLELLKLIKETEVMLGRDPNSKRWAPREIDIDIILAEDLVIQNDNITIPHPQMHNRDFVLVPSCEICEDLVHPILKKTLKELMLDLL